MSKKLEITGLAQETDFADPQKTRTVLVINSGAHRIPIGEDSVQNLLKYAFEGTQMEEPESSTSNGHSEEVISEDQEEQVEEQTDEAGISQI